MPLTPSLRGSGGGSPEGRRCFPETRRSRSGAAFEARSWRPPARADRKPSMPSRAAAPLSTYFLDRSFPSGGCDGLPRPPLVNGRSEQDPPEQAFARLSYSNAPRRHRVGAGGSGATNASTAAATGDGLGIVAYLIFWIRLAPGPGSTPAMRVAEERFARGKITVEDLQRNRSDPGKPP